MLSLTWCLYVGTWLMNIFGQTLPVFCHGFYWNWHTMMKGLLSAILLSEENNSVGKLLAEFSSAQCFVLIPPRPHLICFCLFFLFLFFFFQTQKNWLTVNWTWQKWHSLKLVRNKSCRQSWKLSMIYSDPMAGQSSGTLTVRALLYFLSQLHRQGGCNNQ